MESKEVRIQTPGEHRDNRKQQRSSKSTASCQEKQILQIKHGNDKQDCKSSFFERLDADPTARFDKYMQNDISASVYNGFQPSVYSKKKCVDWMSRIQEETTSHVLKRSSSKFELSCHQRKIWDTHADTHQSYTVNGKKFFKAKSDLQERFKGQMKLNYRLDEGFNRYSFSKPALSVSKEEIQSVIFEVLDNLGEEKLDILIGNLESGGDVIEDNSIGTSHKRAVNIIPECEQKFTRSPHPKKKYQVTMMKFGHIEENYIKMKTGVFSASTEDDDNHVGEINVSIQYLIVTKRLKVKIETLNIMKHDGVLNMFVNVSLEEGMNRKSAKRTKHVRVKKTSIEYDQNLFFENVDFENVHLHCLRFQVFKKPAFFLKKNKCFGECFIYLDNCDVVGNVKICKSLSACE